MIYQAEMLSVDWLEGEPGIVELRFDAPGQPVNTLSQAAMAALNGALAAIEETEGVSGLLITSAKEGAFIAGADITEFNQFFSTPDEELLEALAAGNAVMSRLEDLPIPTVAEINGAALGGGFELCLAAGFRVLAANTIVGLPEVKLGIQPGFGGTVRLPRVIGVDNAVEWVAGGKNQKSDAALKVGAVDAVVAPDQLRKASVDLLRRAIDGEFDFRARAEEKRAAVKLDEIEQMLTFTSCKGFVAQQAGTHMPAPLTSVKSMQQSAYLDRDSALKIESKFLLNLVKGPESKALIGVFLSDQLVGRKTRKYVKAAGEIKTAGVLGAGIMGGGISYQSTLKGIPVVMKDIATAGLDLGMREAGRLLSKRVEKRRMTPAAMAETLASLRPTLSYEGFDQLDIVVEAVVENENIKKSVLAECEGQLKPDAILASNTSTISITRLAQALQRPENFCGMHFFNPVHRMPLVEVIRGDKSSEKAVATTVAYAKAMGKTPIVVNDCPGFYVNRVLFPYFAGFNLLVNEGVDYRQVDKIMEGFGWPMGPAYLMDVVGLDTAQHAAAVMAEGFPDRMQDVSASFLDALCEAGQLGQKTGEGFYFYDNSGKRPKKHATDKTLAKIYGGSGRGQGDPDAETVVARLMVPMCLEAVRCLEEQVISSPAEGDLGLVMGLGFPVFRGGVFRYIEQIGLQQFCELADSLAYLGPLYQVTDGLRSLAAKSGSFFANQQGGAA